MRVTWTSLIFCGLLAAGSCTAGDVSDAPPDDVAEDDAGADGDGNVVDAGRGTNKDAGSGRDAGRDAAGTRDAATTSTEPDSGKAPRHDAGPGAGAGDDASTMMSEGETGREIGMTAAHNAVRAMVQTSPMLPDMVWDPDVAAYAQEWADTLAATACSSPHHRTGAELQQKGYGENLATFGAGGQQGNASTAKQAVNAWASEVACWTYGTISKTEKCDMTCSTQLHSDGCGHYTQVVWRKSIKLGCGVSTCKSGQFNQDIWICNYSPAGNFIGQAPY